MSKPVTTINVVSLALRNFLFTVIVPGLGGVYGPWLILGRRLALPTPFAWPAVTVIAIGIVLYLFCQWVFAAVGRGTPGIWDAPRRLVEVGSYRWVRNPIYIAALLIVLGGAWLFLSFDLLLYAGLLAVAFHVLVVAYEEPRLRARFGEQYDDYRHRVPRWIPRPPVAADRTMGAPQPAFRPSSPSDCRAGHRWPAREGLRMNVKLVAYWIATTLIALETLVGGAADIAHGQTILVTGTPVVDVVTSLGYPVYILTILGIWKLLGAATLLAPRLPRLKEWAYAGIIFELTGAAASLIARGYGAGDVSTPLVLAVIAITSWALRPATRTLGSALPATAHTLARPHR